MSVYYNENDPYNVEWLRESIRQGVIAEGIVDGRSIEDVTPNDLRGFKQCHFFAGIGVWSIALRAAGWPDDRPVWTGSCPCQPFSVAGKRAGLTDERHLWPSWYWLIGECSKTWKTPVEIFGEQVASKDGLAWLDTVQTDLEAAGYAVGVKDFCAAGVGAPHIRQRFYFVAESEHRREGRINRKLATQKTDGVREISRQGNRIGNTLHCGTVNGFWADSEWLYCRDEKHRPVERGTFPLAYGLPRDVGSIVARLRELGVDPELAKRIIDLARKNRTGRLRGYGNAIVAAQAVAFIESYQETF